MQSYGQIRHIMAQKEEECLAIDLQRAQYQVHQDAQTHRGYSRFRQQGELWVGNRTWYRRRRGRGCQ